MISIDVIVANYNNAKFLVRCLDSILNQRHTPNKIIVVDDASTDNSMDILNDYSNQGKILLIKNETNIGVTQCRIKAIATSHSEYFTTLDADDYYYSINKLSAEAATIAAAGGKGIAFSDVLRIDNEGNEQWLVTAKRKLREGDLFFNISHLNGFIPRDYLVSRADYDAVSGYNPNLSLYEDWDLKIRLAKRCDWHYSGEIGTAYRDNPKGLSKAPKQEHVKVMRDIFKTNYSATIKYSMFKPLALIRFFFYHSLYMRRLAI